MGRVCFGLGDGYGLVLTFCYLGDNNYDEWASDEPRDSLGKWI